MSVDHETPDRTTIIDTIKARLDELEVEINENVQRRKVQINDLAGDIRTKVENLRDNDDQDAAQTTVENLKEDLDELSSEIENAVDENIDRVMSIVEDVKQRVNELEQKIRDR